MRPQLPRAFVALAGGGKEDREHSKVVIKLNLEEQPTHANSNL